MSKQGNVRNSQSATSLFFERKGSDKTITQPSKRPREDSNNADNFLYVVNTPEPNPSLSTTRQDTLQIPVDNKTKEKLALKLNTLNDKKARYESHKVFLTKCHKDKIVPQGLSVYIEPSIGNQDEAFLEKWHEKLQSFSLNLMADVITFCDTTIAKVSEDIEKTNTELQSKLDQSERDEIITTLRKNDEINRKYLQQRKTKKYNYST